jgi:hypothetical protein
MIIHNPNIMRLAVDPFKDHPPLIVDSDRMKVLKSPLSFSNRFDGGIAKSSRRFAAFNASSLRFATRAKPANARIRSPGTAPRSIDRQTIV